MGILVKRQTEKDKKERQYTRDSEWASERESMTKQKLKLKFIRLLFYAWLCIKLEIAALLKLTQLARYIANSEDV